MRKFRIVAKKPNGLDITSLDYWLLHAPPAGGQRQWVPGRSALELASRWIAVGDIPEEVRRLLDSALSLRGFVADLAIAERRTAFDEFRAPRAHDLLLIGAAGSKKTIIAIESKSDEPFGSRVTTALSRAEKQPCTDLRMRVDKLQRALFPQGTSEGAMHALRYQLLYGVAGTLAEAASWQASQAVFVVHEFLADNVSQKAVQNNSVALDGFLAILGLGPLQEGRLAGPIRVPGRSPSGRDPGIPADVGLFIGKATNRLHGVVQPSRSHDRTGR